jgi:hypothetical protein
MNQDQLNKIRFAAGVAPKYDSAERQHLAEMANKNTAEKQVVTEAANNRAPNTVIKEIARRHLNVRSLTTQNSDDKDFHEVSVWGIESALKAAFKAGQLAGHTAATTVNDARRGVKEGDESIVEAKKADKDYDGDGKVESSTDEHKGSKNAAIKKAMEKNADVAKSQNKARDAYAAGQKKEKVDEIWDLEKAKKSGMDYKKKNDPKAKDKKKKIVKEMDLELDMGDEGGASDMKQRRMDLIRSAINKVQGPSDMDADMDDGMGGDDMEAGGPMGDESPDESDRDTDMMGGEEMGMGDMEWDDDEGDRDFAMGEFMPEDEEAFAGGFDAFTGGMGEAGCPMGGGRDGRDWKNGYETARMSRMSSVAEGSSEGYSNPKGKAGLKGIAGSNKTGADCKKGSTKDKPHKDNSEGYTNPKGKAGLKNIGEANAVDANVLNKDYHTPVGANGHLDMAQKGVHVQNKGMEEKINVPNALKKSLKEEIANLTTDAGKVRYRDEYRSDFYEATAEAFSLLLAHLEEGTKQSIALAQIDLNRVMSPMTERLPRDVYMYIVRGGKPASLTELFKEVKVKSAKGVDPSKEKYTK